MSSRSCAPARHALGMHGENTAHASDSSCPTTPSSSSLTLSRESRSPPDPTGIRADSPQGRLLPAIGDPVVGVHCPGCPCHRWPRLPYLPDRAFPRQVVSRPQQMFKSPADQQRPVGPGLLGVQGCPLLRLPGRRRHVRYRSLGHCVSSYREVSR